MQNPNTKTNAKVKPVELSRDQSEPKLVSQWRRRVALIQQAIDEGDTDTLRILEEYEAVGLCDSAIEDNVSLQEYITAAEQEEDIAA